MVCIQRKQIVNSYKYILAQWDTAVAIALKDNIMRDNILLHNGNSTYFMHKETTNPGTGGHCIDEVIANLVLQYANPASFVHNETLPSRDWWPVY